MKISTLFLTLIILSSFNKIFSQDIFINKDTTINNTWNIPPGAILKFGSKGHIGGKGTIRGGIIDAALGQWIFDSTLTLNPEGTYGTAFSAVLLYKKASIQSLVIPKHFVISLSQKAYTILVNL